jgi:citrate lyase subunit beta/citryl-CoA lyase
MAARTLLYVPADRPEFLAKALDRGADGIIIDLEDAVAHPRKADARAAATTFLSELVSASPDMGGSTTQEASSPVLASASPGMGGAATQEGGRGVEVWVRVNADEHLEADVAAVAPVVAAGIVVAKADPPTVERVLAIAPDLDLLCLIESGVGLLFAPDLAAHPRVTRLMLGEADLGADLGIDPADEEMWAPHRARVVMASAAAGISPPVGPVATDFSDTDALAAGTDRLRRMGFGGRSCIHPAQVPVVNDVFTPSDDEVAAAADLLARHDAALAAGTGVFLDSAGRMVDEAVVRHARDVVDRGRR